MQALEARCLLTAVAIGDVPASEYPTGVTTTSTARYPNASRSDVAELNGSIYYIAPTAAGKVGLWKSSATPTLIYDTGASASNSVIFNMVSTGTKLAFLIGAELFISNGMTFGTSQFGLGISDGIYTPHINQASVAVFGNMAYFGIPTTGDSGTDRALIAWNLASGTFSTWSMTLINATNDPTTFAKLGNDVYFVGTDGLYKSTSGTGSPTRVFSKNFLTSGEIHPKIAANSSTLLFTGGVTLYSWNGSTTQQISGLTSPSAIASNGTTFYLGALADSQTGTELYQLNGTTPQLLVDAWPDAAQSSSPQDITFAGGKVFFTANSSVGREVWEWDGFVGHLVQDTWPGATSSSPDLIAYQNHAYFTAIDPVEGPSLHRIESDDSVTTLDPVSGIDGIDPQLRTSGSFLSFWGNDPEKGYALFEYDGSSMNIVGDYNPATFSPSIPIAAVGSKLYMGTGDVTPDGNELYEYDGSTFSLLDDIYAGPLSSDPQGLAGINGQLYFSARTLAAGREPWISNDSGPSLLSDLVSGTGSSSPADFHAFGTEADFSATDSTGNRYLAITDGTQAGTKITFQGIYKIVPYNTAHAFSPFNAWQAIVQTENVSNGEIRRVQQTGTSIGSSFWATANSPTVAADGYGFYIANSQPWVEGGSPFVNFQLTTISGTGQKIYGFAETGGKVMYLTALSTSPDYTSVQLLATNLGTKTTETVFGAAQISPIFTDNGTFYFGAKVNGVCHLYRSQGTLASTVASADFQDVPRNFIKVSGHIYFVATGSSGAELYTTDGTPEGTLLVADVNPGPGASEPNNLTDLNGTLAFTANDGTSLKLFKLTPPAIPLHTIGGSFDPNTNTVAVRFTDTLNVDPADLVVTTGSSGSVSPFSAAFDNTKWTGTWTLSANPASLPDGNYHASLDPTSVADAYGNHPAEGLSLDFFVLAGDANRDRIVNALDFNALATNYGKPATFTQGDFDYSGTVDSTDFAMLASRFGTYLAPPSGSDLPNAASAEVPAVSLAAQPSSLFSDKPVAGDSALLDDSLGNLIA